MERPGWCWSNHSFDQHHPVCAALVASRLLITGAATPPRLRRGVYKSMKQFSLEGKAAIVTGSSRGIGRAIAEGLARAGAAVTVNGRSPDATQTVAGAIAAAGGKSLAVPADVGDAAEVERLIDVTVRTFGHLDILVNNAGIS